MWVKEGLKDSGKAFHQPFNPPLSPHRQNPLRFPPHARRTLLKGLVLVALRDNTRVTVEERGCRGRGEVAGESYRGRLQGEEKRCPREKGKRTGNGETKKREGEWRRGRENRGEVIVEGRRKGKGWAGREWAREQNGREKTSGRGRGGEEGKREREEEGKGGER